jgi:predicted PurR-regulated permease PerM
MLRSLFIGLLLVLFVWVCIPLITPVAMGGVFALLFYPWFEKLEKRRVPSALAALATAPGTSCRLHEFWRKAG